MNYVVLQRILLASSLSVTTAVTVTVGLAIAQAPPPATPSGLNTRVDLSSSPPAGKIQYDITGGTRPGGAAGTNLFHSFGNFNVPTNNIANFLNSGSVDAAGNLLPAGLATTNILGRVTSGNPSAIFGMIQTNGPGGFGNANLFLMNPAGFLFGPNATLNVGGMVAFTTADYLRFDGTQTRFNNASTPDSLSPLSTAPVAAFGFLGNNPAAIAIQGSTLQVADGRSLSLVGGNQGFTATDPDTGNPIQVPNGITVTGGKLLAPGGQINIASVAGPGEISAVDFIPTAGTAMGNISLSQGALLDVSADAGGTVRIRGGTLVISDATISADTSSANGQQTAVDIQVDGNLTISDTRGTAVITARTTGSGDAGEVHVKAANLDATSSAESQFFPVDTHFALIDTHTSGSGKAGNVTIETTGDLNVKGQPTGPLFFIDSGTVGLDVGHGGDVALTAKNIRLESANVSTGDAVALNSFQDASGSGGNVTITADTLSMNRSVILSDGFWAGRAGDITINVRNIEMNTFSGLSLQEFGGGGKLTINTDRFIADSAQITSDTILGPGGGFTITGKIIEFRNGTTLRSQTEGDGNAGDIRITASEHLILADDPSTLGALTRPTGLYTNSLGGLGSLGNSGSIIITTPRLEIMGGARINSTTQSSGRGGDVIINATNRVTISGERPSEVIEEGVFGLGSTRASGIYTRTVGSDFCAGPCGDAGHVSIQTPSFELSNGGVINSGTTNSGRGGDVSIHATDTMSIFGTMADGTPGGIFSQSIGVEPNSGSGGKITLSTSRFQLTDGAQISASTLGSGNAGNVILQGPASPAQSVLIDGAASGIFTDTQGNGAGGNIFVNANAVTVQNGGTVSAATSGTLASSVGGTITVNAPDTVTLTSGAKITASSTGPGNTGDIQINAGNQFAMTNSTVTTEANKSGGGIIKITTNPNGTVQLTDSTISASVLDGNGGGGSVNIDPQSVVLINSQILAQAVQGPGGNINITTNLLLPDSTSIISASSQFGQQGTVIIQSPISPASGKIVPLGQKPLLATSLLSQRCAAIAGGSISSFSLAGRDSLPVEPGGLLSSPLALSMTEYEEGTVREADRMMSDETPLLSLRKIAPPGFLTQAFGVEASDCQS